MYREIHIKGNVSTEQLNFISENLGNKEGIKIEIHISHEDYCTPEEQSILLNGKNSFLIVENLKETE